MNRACDCARSWRTTWPRKSALSKSKSGRKRDYEVGGALRNRVNHDGSLQPNLSEALSESFSARIFKWLWNHSLWSRAALLLFVALSVVDYFGFVRAN